MPSTIKEELLHYVWKLKSFDQSSLKTSAGEGVDIVHPGYHNHNAGPDFLDAKIEIDGTLWAGHVEIHIRSSDWHRHRHDADDQYQNVVLHVVYIDDAVIQRIDKTSIPTLEIGSLISSKMIARHQQLMHHQLWIPCEEQIEEVSSITKEATKDKAIIQRLTYKAQQLKLDLQHLNNDLQTLIYHRLAWSFGLKVNAEAMRRLAELTDYSIIQKHQDQPHQVEALLFGQSGLLPEKSDSTYVNTLNREYQVLQQKFGLTSMALVEWKYARLRPANFPTIRIAQFAAFLQKHKKLGDLIFEVDVQELQKHLDVEIDEFWKTHYRFEKSSEPRIKTLGASTKRNIIINAVVPLLFMYGLDRSSDEHKEKAIQLLASLPAESNSIIDRWAALGMSTMTAMDTQALLELKKNNCAQHKCLSCPIGHKIMTGP